MISVQQCAACHAWRCRCAAGHPAGLLGCAGCLRPCPHASTPQPSPPTTTHHLGPSFPPGQRAELNERAEAMSAALTRERLSNTVDTTGTTIGKR